MDMLRKGGRFQLLNISILNNWNAVFGPRAPISPREIDNGARTTADLPSLS